MSGYIEYFDKGRKNHDSVLVKYNETWKKIKKIFNLKI